MTTQERNEAAKAKERQAAEWAAFWATLTPAQMIMLRLAVEQPRARA
jgi:hypothetical protein